MHIPITLEDGETREVVYSFDEIVEVATTKDRAALRLLFKARLISAIKEAGATTRAQMRNAIANKNFEV